ncbi:winged helix-turn-helix transcriptional regulator [Candidatus Saccharibacteria bacterium]|jgi:DNA-binding transcriptional ArsR family regulator|nr:winged helix-turn-helix transcriptional regulator [Candidatus Saccharibacteria bacterium]TXG77855.1 MAG: ArsR family transcriptional regulator [Patescibacteria group bacterium]HPR09098.1 metalloregulator ArsR/SmtB family transcription factor [Candidatus Saccharibacteria bacterium]
MVEHTLQLDLVFNSLADPTRRDILQRVLKTELSISEIAEKYTMSFAAVSKHLQRLERANLIRRRRHGKHYYVQARPDMLQTADEYLEQYRQIWQGRYDKLEQLVHEKE